MDSAGVKQPETRVQSCYFSVFKELAENGSGYNQNVKRWSNLWLGVLNVGLSECNLGVFQTKINPIKKVRCFLFANFDCVLTWVQKKTLKVVRDVTLSDVICKPQLCLLKLIFD